MIPAFFHLLEEARSEAPFKSSPMHGELHWRAVCETALHIAERDTTISPRVVVGFGISHDCRRFNENFDPKHGERASGFVRSSEPIKDLFDELEIEHLAYACRYHEDGHIERFQTTIGCCWDADRFNLTRIGAVPNPQFFSTDIALVKFDEILQEVDTFVRRPSEWIDIFTKASHLEAKRAFTRMRTHFAASQIRIAASLSAARKLSGERS